jgi:hypothetical protein
MACGMVRTFRLVQKQLSKRMLAGTPVSYLDAPSFASEFGPSSPMLGPSSLLVVVQGGLKATCVMHIWDDMGLYGTIFDLFPKK